MKSVEAGLPKASLGAVARHVYGTAAAASALMQRVIPSAPDFSGIVAGPRNRLSGMRGCLTDTDRLGCMPPGPGAIRCKASRTRIGSGQGRHNLFP